LAGWHAASRPLLARALAKIVRRVAFFADEFHEIGVGHELMVYAYGERLGVGFGIFYGDVDLHQAELGPAPALGHFAGVGERAALDVQPHIVAETYSFHYQRVTFIVPDRIAVPPGRGVVIGQRAATSEDAARVAVGFIHDYNLARGLNDFAGLRMHVELRQAEREAERVGIVLVVIAFSLRANLLGPGGERKLAVFEAAADVEELRDGRIVGRGGNGEGQSVGAIGDAGNVDALDVRGLP